MTRTLQNTSLNFWNFQGMLEDTDTREKVAHSSYTDMEQLDFKYY